MFLKPVKTVVFGFHFKENKKGNTATLIFVPIKINRFCAGCNVTKFILHIKINFFIIFSSKVEVV